MRWLVNRVIEWVRRSIMRLKPEVAVRLALALRLTVVWHVASAIQTPGPPLEAPRPGQPETGLEGRNGTQNARGDL